MSYRLKNLATGNFLLIFEAEHGGQMKETLAVVVSALPITDDGEEIVYSLVGITRTAYGLSWSSRSVSSGQDLKFTPLAQHDANQWLAANKIADKFASTYQAAKVSFDAASLACEGLSTYFMGDGPAVLEAAQ